MTKDEALNIAIDYMNERLEEHDAKFQRHPVAEAERNNILADIEAVKEALSQPEQKPVAAECKFDTESMWLPCAIEHHHLVQSEPHKWPEYQTRLLYTTPPQRTWVGLTDEEFESLQRLAIDPVDANGWGFLNRERFAYLIEAKLKEKNT